MHFSTIIATAAALFLGAEAGAVPRQDPHITDFRIWSEQGCGAAGNLGVWTITKSQTDVCQTAFNAPDNVVKAIRISSLTEGCETDCGEGGRQVGVQTCEEWSDIADNFLSFKVTCS
ncbi:uncharacterized protein CLUP02_04610 [Colletotrichum lupini]|uniref:Uncharacterized protein n=1 Tax=Colletotrichum lupini TaxID=145971 RepID=A0A9Q8WDG7_9PEZI|nr:uncharacterized protein CLUP02_04610 [Colletotrichum lupini]UQC79131.1 hypothetical protein CLUP02_04610 [Colletotrichum lupini]